MKNLPEPAPTGEQTSAEEIAEALASYLRLIDRSRIVELPRWVQ